MIKMIMMERRALFNFVTTEFSEVRKRVYVK